MTISEKVAYLKGLADGMELSKETTKESKMLTAILDVLEQVGLSIEDLENTTESLGEEIDAVSDDLADVEEYLTDEDEEDEDEEEEDEDEEDEDDFFEVQCPNCGETLVIDADVLDAGAIRCPNCGETLSLDFSGGCECDGGCCEDKDENE